MVSSHRRIVSPPPPDETILQKIHLFQPNALIEQDFSGTDAPLESKPGLPLTFLWCRHATFMGSCALWCHLSKGYQSWAMATSMLARNPRPANTASRWLTFWLGRKVPHWGGPRKKTAKKK